VKSTPAARVGRAVVYGGPLSQGEFKKSSVLVSVAIPTLVLLVSAWEVVPLFPKWRCGTSAHRRHSLSLALFIYQRSALRSIPIFPFRLPTRGKALGDEGKTPCSSLSVAVYNVSLASTVTFLV
jgi:hypothetical protein